MVTGNHCTYYVLVNEEIDDDDDVDDDNQLRVYKYAHESLAGP